MIGIIVLGVGAAICLWLVSMPVVVSPSTEDYYKKHYEYGKFDCSDRAKVVFNTNKFTGGSPSLEYGCKEENHNCHAWVLNKNKKILCGGSANFIRQFDKTRFTWNSIEDAMRYGFH